ncbi:MAG: hypothetical protein ACREA2_04225 [Blastocatellia bacterium]
MKIAREKSSIFTSHGVLKRLMAEYGNFDTASRLCADYCITANEIALLIGELPKPKKLKSKSRLTFVMRADRTIDIGAGIDVSAHPAVRMRAA